MTEIKDSILQAAEPIVARVAVPIPLPSICSGTQSSFVWYPSAGRDTYVRQVHRWIMASCLVAVALISTTCLYIGAMTQVDLAFGASIVIMALLTVPCLAASFHGGRLLLAIIEPRRREQSTTPRSIPDCRSLIAIPVIIRGLDDVAATLAATSACAGFGQQVVLLVDFGDAEHHTIPTDCVLQSALEKALDKETYTEREDKPLILIRDRRYNKVDGIWMGWERKRGKIEEFCKALSGDRTTGFLNSVPEHVQKAEALIVLDVDSRITSDTIRHLLTASKATIPMPAFVTPTIIVASSSRPTFFQKLHCIKPLNDAYDAGNFSKSLNARIFDRDLFFGKGLINVRPYLDRLADKLPENAVLSHDHVESMIGGCVHAPRALLFEGFPLDRKSWASRQLRWLRGDFQLFGMLNRPGLGTWGRLTIIENAVNHIAPLAVVVATIVSLSARVASTPFLVWGCGIFLLSSGAALMPLNIANEFHSATQASPSHLFLVIGRQVRNAAIQMLYNTVYALENGMLAARAVTVVAYRKIITGRALLEWQDRPDNSRSQSVFLVISLLLFPTPSFMPLSNLRALFALQIIVLIYMLGPFVVETFNQTTLQAKRLAPKPPGNRPREGLDG